MSSDPDVVEWGKGNATFLFGDLKGYTSVVEKQDSEEVALVMADLFGRFGDEIERFGGRLAQQHREGDGFLALFGYPTRREDDPHRALECALALQDLVAASQAEISDRLGVNLPLRIGVTTGPIVVERHDWGENFTGDAVNVAARLESSAEPGEILVAESTCALARRGFEWGPSQTRQLKNRSEPVSARSLQATAPSDMAFDTGSGPFIGRTAQLSELATLWAKTMAGEPQLVVLEGSAGSGKSRLLHEFIQRLHERGDRPRVALGSSPPFGTAALDPLRGMVIGCQASPHMLSVRLDGATKAAVDVLVSAGADKKVRRRTEFVAGLIGFFDRWIGDDPGIVVLEDAHWADASSLRVLAEIRSGLASKPVLTVLVRRQRGQPLPRGLRQKATVVHVEPFGRDEAAQLLDHLLPEAVRGQSELRQTILDKAEGSPFFVEEIVRMVAPASQDDGESQRASTINVPESIEQIFLARLDEIDERSRRLAQEASVVGRRFPDELLAAVTESTIGAALRRLERSELLRYWESDHYEQGHEFTHYLTWNTIYESLLIRRRGELHLKTAAAIESLYPESLDQHAEALALHYELGGREDLAVKYYLRAEEKAAAVHADREARANGRRSARLAGLTSIWLAGLAQRGKGWRARAGAVSIQMMTGLVLMAPFLLFLVLRKPPNSARTLGLPLAVFEVNAPGLVVPLLIGAVPVFVICLVVSNARAVAYLRSPPSPLVLLRDVAATWVLMMAAALTVVGLLYVAVRAGRLGIVLESYYISTSSLLLRGEAWRTVLTFVVASAFVAFTVVGWLEWRARGWRVYLGRRHQLGQATEAEPGDRRIYSQYARVVSLAILVGCAVLVLQLLPVDAFATDPSSRRTASAVLAGCLIVFGAVALVLWSRSRGVSIRGGLSHAIAAAARSSSWRGSAVRRPRGLGFEVPLVLAVLFGLAIIVPVRDDVLRSYRASEAPPSLDDADRLVDWFPNAAFPRAARGAVHLRAGDPVALELAATDFARALELDPELSLAHAASVIVEMNRGDVDAALESAEALVASEPEHPTAYYTRMGVRGAAGDVVGALEDQAAVLDLDREDSSWDALTTLCAVKVQLGRIDEALDDCVAAAEANSYLLEDFSGFRGELVRVHRLADRESEAIAFLEDAGVERSEIAAALSVLGEDDFALSWDYSFSRHFALGALYDVTGFREQAAARGVAEGYMSFFLDEPAAGAEPAIVLQLLTVYGDVDGARMGFVDHSSADGYERLRRGSAYPGTSFEGLRISPIDSVALDLGDEAVRTRFEVTTASGPRIEDVIVTRRDQVVTLYVHTSDVAADIDVVELAELGQDRLADWYPG